MRDNICIHLFSATSWSDEAIWVRYFELNRIAMGLMPRKMGPYEPLRMSFPSVEEAATRFAYQPRIGSRTWLLNYGHRIHADIQHYSSREYHLHGRLFNNVSIHIPLSSFKTLGLEQTTRNWFLGLCELFHAFYGDVEMSSTARQERPVLQSRWNLSFEFPTLGWLTYFSNRVVSFFGTEKVQLLSQYVKQFKDGILIEMGDTPEEAASRREEKFEVERILGANSFVVPVTLPKVDESMIDYDKIREMDPFYHLPKMPNGERKPERVYVPSFDDLACEFQTSDPQQHNERQ